MNRKLIIGIIIILILAGLVVAFYLNKSGPVPYAPTPTGENKPPVISSFSGPTSLAVNETGIWKADVTDPENDNLKYMVRWGDEPPTMDVTYPFNWPGLGLATEYRTPVFTHVYKQIGTYSPSVYVVDNEVNHVAGKTVDVKVGQQGMAPHPNVVAVKVIYSGLNGLSYPAGVYLTGNVKIFGSDYLRIREGVRPAYELLDLNTNTPLGDSCNRTINASIEISNPAIDVGTYADRKPAPLVVAVNLVKVISHDEPQQNCAK